MDRRLDKQRGRGTIPADESGRAALPTVAEIVGGVVTLRRAPGATSHEITTAEREQLLADARDGKLVKVVVDAVTFIQRDTPNRNFIRFTPGALRTLAPSFAGMPVLRDHEQGDALARGGRVLESKLEDHADGKQIAMTLELTAPWAVELAVRGLMDRFSIGWHSEGNTQCSICGEPMTSFWMWTFSECDHELGDTYEGQICQLEYTDGVGIEVSAVSVPAVVGTGIEDIRAQLSAARAASPAGLGRTENRMKIAPIILAALGLSADAEDSAAIAGIEKLKTDRDGAQAALKDAQTQLATAKQEIATVAATGKAQRIEATLSRGLNEGRYLPGSKVEAHVKKLAERGDEEGLAAYVDDLPKGGAAPIGVARQSATAPGAGAASAKDVEEAAASAQLSVIELGVARQMNPPLSAVQFLKTKQKMAGTPVKGEE